MFGGLSFMVDANMVVCVRSDGALRVRAAAERADQLLAREGARPAGMGAGRSMAKNWISVEHSALSTGEALDFWVGGALDVNREAAGTRRPQG